MTSPCRSGESVRATSRAPAKDSGKMAREQWFNHCVMKKGGVYTIGMKRKKKKGPNAGTYTYLVQRSLSVDTIRFCRIDCPSFFVFAKDCTTEPSQ